MNLSNEMVGGGGGSGVPQRNFGRIGAEMA